MFHNKKGSIKQQESALLVDQPATGSETVNGRVCCQISDYTVRMGLLERCQELFKTSNLYEVLGIQKDAAEGDIRRSYYKVSLKVHPDRSPDDPLATEKFQVIVKKTLE